MKNLFKIDASAGSGKTYSLTRRFLELLASSDMNVNAHCNILSPNTPPTDFNSDLSPKNIKGNSSHFESLFSDDSSDGFYGDSSGNSSGNSSSDSSSSSSSSSSSDSFGKNKRTSHYNFAEIMAVTFTNLAATQMQERIIGALKNIALGENKDGDKWTEEQAINALEQIFRRYSALNIKTIDSLLHHLVRISALELEISPQFEVTFDKTQIMSPIFDEIATRALHDKEIASLFYKVCDSIIEYKPKFRSFLAGDSLKNQCMSIAYDLVNAGLNSENSIDNEDLTSDADFTHSTHDEDYTDNTDNRNSTNSTNSMHDERFIYDDDSTNSMYNENFSDNEDYTDNTDNRNSTNSMHDERFIYDDDSTNSPNENTHDLDDRAKEDIADMLDNMGLSLEELEKYAYGLNSLDYFDEKYTKPKKQHSFTSKAELEEIFNVVTDDIKKTGKEMLEILQKEKLSANANFPKALVPLIQGINKNSVYFSKDSLDECLNKSSKGEASTEAIITYTRLKESVRAFNALEPIIRKALQYLPMLELAQLIENKVWQTEKEKSLLLSSRMPFLVSKILRNEYYVSGAFCRMGARLNHILLDEFQDTSGDQWKALEPLTREALSLAGSVFFVGDVKQAIYGWRGGDAELFNSAPEGLIPYASGYEHTPLQFNWRSEAFIVEWNNAFFASLTDVQNVKNAIKFFEKEMDGKLKEDLDLQEISHACAEKIANIYASSKQNISPKKLEMKKQGFVQLHHINVPKKKNKLATLSLVTASVQALRERHKWQNICVLTVTNAQASLVSELLLSQSIPVVSQGSLLMAEHPIIIELTALMRFLSNPLDEQAFWHVLISKHILPTNLYEKPLFEFLASRKKTSLFQAFKENFDDIWQLYFKPLIDGAGLMTAYDTLCEVYKRWEVRERNQDADIFLLRFLEIVHLAEENALMDLDAFLAWWDTHAEGEKAPLPQNMGAVSVMTVHKAKGLEFDAVLIPWHDFKVDPDRENAQIINYKYKDKNLKIFSTLMKAHGRPYYKALFDKVLECINTLYVAWTRPIKELHIFLPQDTDKAFPHFLQYMLEAFRKELPENTRKDDTGNGFEDASENTSEYALKKTSENDLSHGLNGNLNDNSSDNRNDNLNGNLNDNSSDNRNDNSSGNLNANLSKNSSDNPNSKLSTLCSSALNEHNDYTSYGILAPTESENNNLGKKNNLGEKNNIGDENKNTKSLIDSKLLRMLEYYLCASDESFAPIYEVAKEAVKSEIEKTAHFIDLDDEDFENMQGSDILYVAKKISSLFTQLSQEKMEQKNREASQENKGENKTEKQAKNKAENTWGNLLNLQDETRKDTQKDTQKNILLAPQYLQKMYEKKWERPMAWLPRLKVFRSNLEDIRNHAQISTNKRGTMMHKCLESLVYSGDIKNDVHRAIKDAMGFLPTNFQESDEVKTFYDALLWFLSLENPFGGAKEWLRYGLKEHALSSSDGKMYRVDLLVNRPRSIREENDTFELIAVDYKTGYHGELPNKENVEQIKNYLCLLAEATQKPSNITSNTNKLDKSEQNTNKLDKSEQNKSDYAICEQNTPESSISAHQMNTRPKNVIGMLVYLDRKEICIIEL